MIGIMTIAAPGAGVSDITRREPGCRRHAQGRANRSRCRTTSGQIHASISSAAKFRTSLEAQEVVAKRLLQCFREQTHLHLRTPNRLPDYSRAGPPARVEQEYSRR